jgi:hypothetical protein
MRVKVMLARVAVFYRGFTFAPHPGAANDIVND